MIDVTHEETVTLAQLAKRIPRHRQDRPVAIGTILRWVTKGTRTYDGRTVRLEAFRLAGKWYTSTQAYQRFVTAQTPADPEMIEPRRGPKARTRAAEVTAARLDALGVGL